MTDVHVPRTVFPAEQIEIHRDGEHATLALPTRKDVHAVAGRGAFTKYPSSVHGWGAQVGFRHVWNDVANNELTAVIQGKESVDSMLQKIAAAAR